MIAWLMARLKALVEAYEDTKLQIGRRHRTVLTLPKFKIKK